MSQYKVKRIHAISLLLILSGNGVDAADISEAQKNECRGLLKEAFHDLGVTQHEFEEGINAANLNIATANDLRTLSVIESMEGMITDGE